MEYESEGNNHVVYVGILGLGLTELESLEGVGKKIDLRI